MTLEHALLEQFHLIEVSSLDREIGEYLIGNLEDDGLLYLQMAGPKRDGRKENRWTLP